MTKAIVERFLIGGSAGHPSMPSTALQRAFGNEIEIDVMRQEMRVPTENGHKIAIKGDTIICYSDGTYDIQRKRDKNV